MMRGFESLLPRQQYAEMAERLKAPVLKTGDVKASVGSNPTLRAKEKNIINLLTFTNECVILISSSEPNKNILQQLNGRAKQTKFEMWVQLPSEGKQRSLGQTAPFDNWE